MKQWNEIYKKEGYKLEPHEQIPSICKFFNEAGVKKILDLGCGTGRNLIYLVRNGFDLYGFDIAEEGIRQAKKRLKDEKLNAEFNIGSIYEKLPYPDNFFDAVISIDAFYHAKIEDVQKAIREVERILKPGGLFFVNFLKRRIRKFDPEKALIKKRGMQKVSYQMIASKTYIPIEGGEKGLPHYLFDRQGIKKGFKCFKMKKFWVCKSGRHYYFLGEKKI